MFLSAAQLSCHGHTVSAAIELAGAFETGTTSCMSGDGPARGHRRKALKNLAQPAARAPTQPRAQAPRQLPRATLPHAVMCICELTYSAPWEPGAPKGVSMQRPSCGSPSVLSAQMGPPSPSSHSV